MEDDVDLELGFGERALDLVLAELVRGFDKLELTLPSRIQLLSIPQREFLLVLQ